MIEEVRLDKGKIRQRRRRNSHVAKAFSPSGLFVRKHYCQTGGRRQKSIHVIGNLGNVDQSSAEIGVSLVGPR